MLRWYLLSNGYTYVHDHRSTFNAYGEKQFDGVLVKPDGTMQLDAFVNGPLYALAMHMVEAAAERVGVSIVCAIEAVPFRMWP
jgi:hypothetical protein